MRFIIDRKILVSMVFIAASMLGYISYQQLKVEIMPNAELPELHVQISSRLEVTPEYMEQKAVIPVESAVAALENIELIKSTASRRNGTVSISYSNNADLKYAYLKLSEKVTEIESELPDGFSLRVNKEDITNISSVLMNLQVLGTGGIDRVRNIVDQKIAPELENVDGVAGIRVFGGQQKSIDIILNKSACEAYNIAPTRVRNILSRNMNMRSYGGMVKEMGQRYFIYIDAEYENIEQIEDLVVGRGNNPVKLKDIATIHYGVKEEETISRVNGKEAISISIINDSQQNIIDLSHDIRKVVKILNDKLLSEDIEVIIQYDVAEMMENNIDEIINLALSGGILAIFILWIFLRNIRLVLLVAFAMPISIYTAFNFFYGAGITINSLTLVGIALAVGMLLDTSVVVLENIYRLRSNGYSPSEAVLKGTKEVWRSVFAATLTTIAVFVPFIFSNDIFIKLIGKNIGVSIISTLSISLIVSLMLIPMAVNVLLKRNQNQKSEIFQKISLDNKGVRFYLFLLKASLRNPATVTIIGLLLFFVTIIISFEVSNNSLRELETNMLSVNLTMPSGNTLETSDNLIAKFETDLAQFKEIENISSNIQDEEARLTIQLIEDYEKINNFSFTEIRERIESSINEIKPNNVSVSISALSSESRGGGRGGGNRRGGNAQGNQGLEEMMGIGEDEEYIEIKGQDFELMVEVAEALQTYIEESENISRANISVRENQPEVHLDFYAMLMHDYNITHNQVLDELNSFQNEIESGVNFRQGSEEYEIMIKFDDTIKDEDREKTIKELRVLPIPNETDDNLYELESISDVFFARGMREINRVNQEKQITLSYRYISDVNDSKDLKEFAREEIEEIIASTNIPTGISVEMVQEESQMNKFKHLFLLIILLIYMILAAVFESFVTPFVLLFSIPLAAIGSFFFLSITGNSLQSANSITGFLILLGVVVNNGIILIDFINIQRKNGFRRQRAILNAGLSRVRPILITAITTSVAMIPLAMGDSEYVKAMGPPFAVTVIGGLMVSTLLTLVYIPTLYNAIENSLSWIKSLGIFYILGICIAVVGGIVFVIVTIEQFIWELAAIICIVIGVPAVLYFVLSSLKKATVKLIDERDELFIEISNLVKVYGRPVKISRDIISNRKMLLNHISKYLPVGLSVQALIWQIPALIFLVFFTWFYLQSNFWQFVLVIITWLFSIQLVLTIYKSFNHKLLLLLVNVLRYLSPLALLALLYLRWNNLALTIVVTFFWYLTLLIRYTSGKLISKKLILSNTPKLFRWFVWILMQIPGIGYKREQFKALRGVSLQIGTGMFGLLGPNGAGKSTIIRIICGIYEQSYGKIWINGIDTQKKREELQGLIGYLPQEFGMYENMSAYAYLEYQAILKGITNAEIRVKRIEYVLNSVHMWNNKDKKIGSFSGGMKQRIGIAQVLLHLPRILVVDEPTAGLDPRERIRFRNLLVELSRSRIVIFSTHIIEDISSSCNNVAVINKGEVLFNGTPKEMTQIARGKVWRAELRADEFEEETKDMLVVHHMRENENIRARCITANKPFENAVEESPLLEDAYLWLLQQSKLTN